MDSAEQKLRDDLYELTRKIAEEYESNANKPKPGISYIGDMMAILLENNRRGVNGHK